MADKSAESVLFQKHDALLNDVTDLKIRTGANERMLEQHAEMFRKMNLEQAANHRDIVTRLDNFGIQITSMKEDDLLRKGAEQQREKDAVKKGKSQARFQWGVGIMLTIITILISVAAFLK